ncbi:MAG: metallophosphoesterase [Geobacteraceae bacterium]|nr:metallophosphoesterase [Geobacteraceae bacterium]
MDKGSVRRRGSLAVMLVTTLFALSGCGSSDQSTTQFVFTSDAHYGIKRTAFDGYSSAQQVNGAMVTVMNTIPGLTLPCNDAGVNSCKSVGAIDFVAETGDIANRMEANSGGYTQVQSAAISWNQFKSDYIDRLELKDKTGKEAALYIVPGNHDVTDAIGFYKAMTPTSDATSIAEIFNLMMNPTTQRTKDSYDYSTDKVFFSKDINGVHYEFITMWPDSVARAWMENDLKNVPSTTPVIIFTHDQPDIETKHLMNPNGSHDINATDKFENMVADQSVDTDTNGLLTIDAPSTSEQRDLVTFLKKHKNIVAYFHGNDHINGTYTYTGPDNDISLNVIRVDSPMKGSVSKKDPTQLAFKVVSVAPAAKKMTVRDYMWQSRTWGNSTTFSLAPRSN